MQWATWAPTYEEILRDLGYSRAADEAARDLLGELLRGHARPDLAALAARVQGREVVIAGPYETLLPEAPLFASDAATWAHARADAIVTDLDGAVDAQLAANARGVPLFVHAHGDNVAALRAHVPRMRGPVQGTTQAEPRGAIMDAGGFTDGDRAACLAVHLGATSLALAGFDWERPLAKPGRDPETKRRKLAWARRIVASLGIPVRML